MNESYKALVIKYNEKTEENVRLQDIVTVLRYKMALKRPKPKTHFEVGIHPTEAYESTTEEVGKFITDEEIKQQEEAEIIGKINKETTSNDHEDFT